MFKKTIEKANDEQLLVMASENTIPYWVTFILTCLAAIICPLGDFIFYIVKFCSVTVMIVFASFLTIIHNARDEFAKRCVEEIFKIL